MKMHSVVVVCVGLVCLVAMLADSTEGHITFFSPKEMINMREREGKKGMEPRSEDGQLEDVNIQQLPEAEIGGNNPDKTVEVSVRLSAKQLENMAPVLEEIIHEIVEESQKEEACGHFRNLPTIDIIIGSQIVKQNPTGDTSRLNSPISTE